MLNVLSIAADADKFYYLFFYLATKLLNYCSADAVGLLGMPFEYYLKVYWDLIFVLKHVLGVTMAFEVVLLLIIGGEIGAIARDSSSFLDGALRLFDLIV